MRNLYKTYTMQQKRMVKILKTLVYNQKENIFIELENIFLRTMI